MLKFNFIICNYNGRVRMHDLFLFICLVPVQTEKGESRRERKKKALTEKKILPKIDLNK